MEWTVDDQGRVGGADNQEEEDDEPERDETNTTSTTASKIRKVGILVGFLGADSGGFPVNMEQQTIQATWEWTL
jgi:hypothetical protein